LESTASNSRGNTDALISTLACSRLIFLFPDVPGGLGGLDVGAVTHNNGTPFLTIGPHILEGKVVKLVPPLLILERGDGTVVAEGAAVDGSIEYSVAGIAHTKFLFNERPKLGLKRL